MFTIEKTDDATGVLRNDVTGESIEGSLQNLDAYLKMFGQLDGTIALIRRSPNLPEARAALKDALGVDDAQADAILGLRLQKIVDVTRDHVLTDDERAKLDAERDARRLYPRRAEDIRER